jgi:hypothetical protein
MFFDENLQEHLETSSTIKSQAVVVAEWNLNNFENIYKIGNYRYRKNDTLTPQYQLMPNTFDENDEGYYYTNGTQADIVIDGGLESNNEPITFISKNEKERLLYSLEECFYRFRPRSGINKLRYFPQNYTHFSNPSMSQRPRYYMASKGDRFKYWTSYKTEAVYQYENSTFGANPQGGSVLQETFQRGISNSPIRQEFFIDDAAPFIVYKNPVASNRIILKTQTNVGSINLGPFSNDYSTFEDPFFGNQNKTVPITWKIQYLSDNSWVDAISFDQNSVRSNGESIIGPDGYLEIGYGLIVPDQYADIFSYKAQYTSAIFLPDSPQNGAAFLIKTDELDVGVYYVWINGENRYEEFTPRYGWKVLDDSLDSNTPLVRNLADPDSYISPETGELVYREFDFIQGLRVVVETMSKQGATFDLIELSPRLAADMTDRVVAYSIVKPASDLGISGMPVGQLLAATGSVDIFDFDQAFNDNNEASIIKNLNNKNIQFKFFEGILDVNGINYYVPIKTMYAEDFPEINTTERQVTIPLRDLMLYFESLTAPEILMQNVSLSYAVSFLLDSVGFSNYVFKRNQNEDEMIIPFFFIPPNQTVAEVLEGLATSAQSAMFLDEYNNLVVMSKNYIMPSEEQRPTDAVLQGSLDMEATGPYKNLTTLNKLANIIDLTSQRNNIFNSGKIDYTTRYIQKTYGSIKQAGLTPKNINWIYKPVLLWEVSASEKVVSQNEETGNQSGYSLAAVPLNSFLSLQVPRVQNHQIINNVVDLGEAASFLGRYNGYFFANGEVIKYDAIEYSISGFGNVWINNTQEYKNYFSKLPFNGKIYPTGLVRIYSEPFYESIDGVDRLKNGEVLKHGRGQFGTQVVEHQSGLSPYWSDNQNVRGCLMDSKYLFTNLSTVLRLNANSSGSVLTVADTSGLQVGQIVRIIQRSSGSSGELQENTKIQEVLSGTTFRISPDPKTKLSNVTISIDSLPNTQIGPAGLDNVTGRKTTRNGVIKNFLSNTYIQESEINSLTSTNNGTIQSSALVMDGPVFPKTEKPVDSVSYVYKKLDNSFRHFGTRMRVVGKIENDQNRSQTPNGSSTYYVVSGSEPDKNVNIGGSSGGLGVLVNPETNVGYYFEVVALTEANIQTYDAQDAKVYNLIFYKIKQDGTPGATKAIPIKLWGGIADITADSGNFTGQSRLFGEKNSTVYDLAVEYEDIGATRKFYLYINEQLISIVVDFDPLPVYNNVALFVRGSSRCMFENVYALTTNYSQNTVSEIDTPVNSIFGDSEISTTEAFRKYAISGLVQSTYLSGISSNSIPQYNIYFEEFGTIMREAAYFNVKYDKAYPALYAKISPTFNNLKGYTVSGFIPNAYGAEFLIFNNTDSTLILDETSGNYLRIQGVAFTQEATNQLTVDDYFNNRSDFSDPEIAESNLVFSPIKEKEIFNEIKISRMSHGTNEFSLTPPYIQSQDEANNLMGWIVEKTMRPRRSVGVTLFAMPTLQLGDIVKINYKDNNNIDQFIEDDARFVIYNIEYSKSVDGPSMTAYLSEVK